MTPTLPQELIEEMKKTERIRFYIKCDSFLYDATFEVPLIGIPSFFKKLVTLQQGLKDRKEEI